MQIERKKFTLLFRRMKSGRIHKSSTGGSHGCLSKEMSSTYHALYFLMATASISTNQSGEANV